jgi:hypothetical protein
MYASSRGSEEVGLLVVHVGKVVISHGDKQNNSREEDGRIKIENSPKWITSSISYWLIQGREAGNGRYQSIVLERARSLGVTNGC